MSYIAVPKEISSTEIIEKNFSFSPTQYKKVIVKNSNCIFVSDFLSRKLSFSDLGSEVGSLNYIDKSPVYFFRTKGLQSQSYIPLINSESLTPLNPKAFIQQNLKKNDLIISKDSNIGEAIILDNDYDNWMLSGALYKLPVKNYKYYLFAFLKHDFFREQLDFMVPKSATIRHAKTIFLKCLIPIPNGKNKDGIMQYLEQLVKASINIEIEIKKRHQEIHEKIDNELKENQKNKKFVYDFPDINEVRKIGRLDTGLYSILYKKYKHLISNYKFGSLNINEINNGYVSISRGQNLQETNIGKSIYSDSYQKGFYRLCLSKNFTEFQTVTEYKYVGNKRKLKTIEYGDIIFSCRGDMGRTIIFCDEIQNTITNIDNVHISFSGQELYKTVFVGLFLNYLKNIGYINKISITGSGADSFTKYQFALIDIPLFDPKKQKEISLLYHNPSSIINTSKISSSNFIDNIAAYNTKAGIIELDKTLKKLKNRINSVIGAIIEDKDVITSFDFIDVV